MTYSSIHKLWERAKPQGMMTPEKISIKHSLRSAIQ